VGPIVSSDEARKDELDLSLLQRLFERPLYVNDVATTECFRPCAYLRRNYRSHPAILMPPSALFYNDTLLPCATNGRISWSNLPDQRLPVKIIGSAGDEECIDEVRRASSGSTSDCVNLILDFARNLRGTIYAKSKSF
jgi:helicase MOV-10